jgi:acetyl-CoA carboxylase biotin carboxyl carrier protein
MNLKEIERIIELLRGTDISEIEVRRGNDGLTIRRRLEEHPPGPAGFTAGHLATHAEQQPAAPGEAEGKMVIKSPLVGTFYRSPNPEAKPFVELGDMVSKGQVVCIIEAMKLMNELESDAAGRVTAILVENGRPVEFGEPLFEIETIE